MKQNLVNNTSSEREKSTVSELEVSKCSNDTIPQLLEKLCKLEYKVLEERTSTTSKVADIDNLRKRIYREREETRQETIVTIISTLLPVLDNLRIGLQHTETAKSVINVAKGFSNVIEQLELILNYHGINIVKPNEGEGFYPHSHEAVSHEYSDTTPDHHILRVVRLGYRLNGRLLRPACVVVSAGKMKNSL